MPLYLCTRTVNAVSAKSVLERLSLAANNVLSLFSIVFTMFSIVLFARYRAGQANDEVAGILGALRVLPGVPSRRFACRVLRSFNDECYTMEMKDLGDSACCEAGMLAAGAESKYRTAEEQFKPS